VLATVSAVNHFPVPLAIGRSAEVDALFTEARDAYLARDWSRAEAVLTTLLAAAPTDGEAQLLLATLLRRVGRRDEARIALRKLSASDSGLPWRRIVAEEIARLEAALPTADAAGETATLPLPALAGAPRPRGRAA
jgi:predicted Zn-dependent protease